MRSRRSPAGRPTDRALAWLARVLLLGFYRRVEVHPRRPELGHRPVLVVSNHFNGFVDPVMLVRVPRFLAKSALWDVVIDGVTDGVTDEVTDEAAATVP